MTKRLDFCFLVAMPGRLLADMLTLMLASSQVAKEMFKRRKAVHHKVIIPVVTSHQEKRMPRTCDDQAPPQQQPLMMTSLAREKETTNEERRSSSLSSSASVVIIPARTTQAKASVVPASRMHRLLRYAGLVARLSGGAMAEVTKRTTGLSTDKGSVFTSEQNIERFVDTLARMRGAALKIGQMLSIQDNDMLPPQVEKIFERVRNQAHVMPTWQTHAVLVKQWGPDWRAHFVTFDDQPVAAASIGQVHRGVLRETGQLVAVKVQYPGVAQSILSDLANLRSLLHLSRLLPKGLFLDNAIRVAQHELAWEVDYEREARYTTWFREQLGDGNQHHVLDVPADLSAHLCTFAVHFVHTKLSTKNVLVTEWMEGVSVNVVEHDAQVHRDRVATSILFLCLREIFEFRRMQTDPNWTNFLYQSDMHQMALLDFGATREFNDAFVNDYQELVHATADNNVAACLDWSHHLGFLTGDESTVMRDAHLKALLSLGMPFRTSAPFDFGEYTPISRNVKSSIPIMATHRLTPPPDDSYALHRKLSGAFLLCARLKARVRCRDLLDYFYHRKQSSRR